MILINKINWNFTNFPSNYLFIFLFSYLIFFNFHIFAVDYLIYNSIFELDRSIIISESLLLYLFYFYYLIYISDIGGENY